MTDSPSPPSAPEAGELARRIDAVILDVCELPDRTSPEDRPEDVTLSVTELRNIIESHFGSASLLQKLEETEKRLAEAEGLAHELAFALLDVSHLTAELAEARDALEDYACAGEPEKCGTHRLKDGSCVRLMAGNCGKPAYDALRSAATSGKGE